MWEIKHSKSASIYDRYERKGGDTEITHYCPGCGHGVLHKLIAEAIDDLGIQDRSILVGPVGCSIFMYYYMDVGNISASHGRAPAVATGVKRIETGNKFVKTRHLVFSALSSSVSLPAYAASASPDASARS